jgi:hypothetical protein
MARRGEPEPVEGILSITDDGLTFTAADSPELDLPAAKLRGARRFRGSPVLQVTYAEPDGLRDAFFFFSRPPPLPVERRTSPLSPRGLQRAGNILTLRAEAKRVKPDLKAWVRAIAGVAKG